MIVHFSKNPIRVAAGIALYNKWRLLVFLIMAEIAYTLHHTLALDWVQLPVVPVTILGGALAIFLGFRNSSAYDRWWEARKIWGAIVNDSRTLTVYLINYVISDDTEALQTWQKRVVYRHIGWLYTLKSNLRKTPDLMEKELKDWYTPADQNLLKQRSNIPSQTLALQQADFKYAYEQGWISDYRFTELGNMISKLYDNQGKCERIKNTVFPFYYNFYTRLFLWVFILCLPFALVPLMGWISLPLSIAISFVFNILDKVGIVTEAPFEGRAADTPLLTLCRTIEIDLREMLEDSNIPKPIPDQIGRFGVVSKM